MQAQQAARGPAHEPIRVTQTICKHGNRRRPLSGGHFKCANGKVYARVLARSAPCLAKEDRTRKLILPGAQMYPAPAGFLANRGHDHLRVDAQPQGSLGPLHALIERCWLT